MLTDIIFWMVDNMPENLVDPKALERTNVRYVGPLSDMMSKRKEFLKVYCKLLLKKTNRAAKTPPIKLEGAGLIYNYIAEFTFTKRRVVTVNRELDVNFVNYGAADVLTRNEGAANLEATVYVAVKLEEITCSAVYSRVEFGGWRN